MITVLYDHEIFSCFNRGGVSRNFRELAKHMKSCGVSAVAFGGWHISDASREIPHFIGVRTPALPRTRRAKMFINGLVQRAVVTRLRPHVIHKTLYARDEYPSGIPIVITVHDMAHERGLATNKQYAENKAYWIRRAAHNITPSESTRRELLCMADVDPAKITTVHHGADALPMPVGGAAAWHRPYFLYVGDRHAYKDFPILAKALAATRASRDFSLICCGGVKFSRQETDMIAVLGLGDSVHRIEADDARLSQLYQQARCLVYPSRYEGFGLPVVEAMRLACPVIAADTPVSREVSMGEALFFEAGSVESLRDVIKVMAYDDAKREEIRIRGAKAVAGLTWAAAAEHTALIYRSIMS